MAVTPPPEYAWHFQQFDNLREITRQEGAFEHFSQRWDLLVRVLRDVRASSENASPTQALKAWQTSRIAMLSELRRVFLLPFPEDERESLLDDAREGLPLEEEDPSKQLKSAEIELLRLAKLTLEEISQEFQGEIRLPQWDRARQQVGAALEAVPSL